MSAVAITVPSVGESISEAIVARWLKADGTAVQAGEPRLGLGTGKATAVVPAPGSGVLETGAAEGQTVAIGASVGRIDASAAPAAAPPSPPEGPSTSARAAPERPDGRDQRPAEPAPPARERAEERPLSPAVRRL